MKQANRKQQRVKGTEDRRVFEFFVKNGQSLLPMVELIEQSSVAVDELIDVVGRSAVETVLQLSAHQITGEKSQGRKTEREQGVRWYGRQRGSVALSDRKLRVERPRLRGQAGEVAIPAYEALRDDARMSARMLELLLGGVSTRNYQHLIREMAETVGVSKSSVSREFVEESARKLQELNERSFTDKQLLVVYLDVLAFLEKLEWPGNVRQLQNVVERSCAVVKSGDDLTLDLFEGSAGEEGASIVVAEIGGAKFRPLEKGETLKTRRQKEDELHIRYALEFCKGNRKHAAEFLGMTRQGLTDRMRELAISDSK